MSLKDKIRYKILDTYVKNDKKVLELTKYIIVGILVTVLDWTVFFAFNEVLKFIGYTETQAAVSAQIASWLAAVTAAYVLNKELVFDNHNHELKYIIKEVTLFYLVRLISGIISIYILWAMVEKMFLSEYIGKMVTTVFNLVFNYIASKFLIFAKVKI